MVTEPAAGRQKRPLVDGRRQRSIGDASAGQRAHDGRAARPSRFFAQSCVSSVQLLRPGATIASSRRAGFDPLSPSVEFRARRGICSRPAIPGPTRPCSHQNGRVPRRNNARKSQGKQSEEAHRVAGLGEHWRADGLPKTRYSSQSDALTAALVRRQESGVELNVYRCDVCGAWHMGKPRGDSSSGGRT
jgi:hypothetical protein